MAAEYHALQVPPPGDEKGGVEVLRAAIIDGQAHMTLRRAFDDPRGWGQLLADVASHAAAIYAQDKSMTPADALTQIRAQFKDVLDQTSNGAQQTLSQLP
jgi:Domain of unknown function (DUF5076)